MRVSILGCGVYGLALANSFLDKNSVTMWSKFQEEVDVLSKKYLSIAFTTDLEEAIRETDLLVVAIPIAFLEETMISLKEVYTGQDILIASKGIDTKKQLFAYEIILNHLDNAPIGILSGGTFASDMMNKQVMGLTIATKVDRIKDKVKLGLESDYIKIQYIDDIVGVSICGAIKNVMAIGFGMLDGANYSPSSRFLFLTEAIYEISNFIELLGGNKETIMSYAGIDDIMMTCTSTESRNYTLGSMIGSGKNKEEIDDYISHTTIEGLGTSEAVYKLVKDKNISLPLLEAIYDTLYSANDVNKLIKQLKRA